jgi:hypothetical protein
MQVVLEVCGANSSWKKFRTCELMEGDIHTTEERKCKDKHGQSKTSKAENQQGSN